MQIFGNFEIPDTLLHVKYTILISLLSPDKYLREFLLWLRLSSFINASDCEEANLKYNAKFNAKFLLAWHTQVCFKLSIESLYVPNLVKARVNSFITSYTT